MLQSLNREAFRDLINQGDRLETWRLIEENIFVLGSEE